MDRIVRILSNFAYTVGCVSLYLISMWIIIVAIIGIIVEIQNTPFIIYKLLDEVALLVFSIAVIDVSKYLMTEEVLREHDRSPRDARRVFTKFVIIIITALCLEGLVITIETAKTDITKLLYPILIFVIATFMMIGLGLYQKLNASSEKN
jgi:hypothetical protein